MNRKVSFVACGGGVATGLGFYGINNFFNSKKDKQERSIPIPQEPKFEIDFLFKRNYENSNDYSGEKIWELNEIL